MFLKFLTRLFLLKIFATFSAVVIHEGRNFLSKNRDLVKFFARFLVGNFEYSLRKEGSLVNKFSEFLSNGLKIFLVMFKNF